MRRLELTEAKRPAIKPFWWAFAVSEMGGVLSRYTPFRSAEIEAWLHWDPPAGKHLGDGEVDLGMTGLSNCVDGGFRPALETKFHQDVADMMTGGLCAYEEAFGDLGIAQALT
jgi:hypothetical protein